MTVDDLLRALTGAFPSFNARAMESWAPVFRARLAKHEGPALQQAYLDTLATFTVSKSKALFPVAADFEINLPSNHPKVQGEGPKLNFDARGDRARKLMAEWRQEQGSRAAGSNRAIMRALEFMVEPLANLWAWSENPRPIRLSRAQVRIVQQRAISQERVRLFGPLGKDGAEWWRQIEQICDGWNIPAIYDEWATKKQHAA